MSFWVLRREDRKNVWFVDKETAFKSFSRHLKEGLKVNLVHTTKGPYYE